MNEDLNKALVEFATDILNASKRELGTRRIGKNRNYGVATRTLQRSLAYKFRYGKKGVTAIQFYAKGKANKYADFIHFGVNGTIKKRGAPFTMKKQPPRSAVRAWMKVKPVRLRDENGAFIKQTEARLNSAAYLIARSIKRKGIEGLFYFEKGYEYAYKKQGKKLQNATAEAVRKQLTARFNSITISAK